jgi:hypothetical protein
VRKFFLIIYLLSGLVFTLSAQVYKGPYTNLVGRSGELEASYKVVDEDTVFDGDFFFVIKQDLKQGDFFLKETYEGNYRNGLKNGIWEYMQLDLQYSVVDIHKGETEIIYWGKKEVLEANYVDGKPEGVWSFIFFHVDSFRNEHVEKIGSIHFKEGIPVGEFGYKSIKPEKYQIDGKFDSLGRLNGEWLIRYPQDTMIIRESRQYERGFLLTLKKSNDSTNQVYDSLVYEEVINKLEAGLVPQAEGNFNILFDDGFLKESDLLVTQKVGNELLNNAFDEFLWPDLGDGVLPGASDDFHPGTGRFEYDLPESFLNDLNGLREALMKIIIRSDEMLENPKFYINFRQSELLSKSEAILKYEKMKANEILRCVNTRDDSLYEHIDQEVYFANIYDKYIDRNDTLKYQYDGEEKFTIIHERVDKDLSPFYKLQEAIGLLNERSKKAMIDIRNEFEKIIQMQRLNALEQDLRFTAKNVEASYVEKGSALSKAIYENSITAWTAIKLQQYANIEELKSKEMEGRYILGVMEDLLNLEDDIHDIEAREGTIDSAYTELVFDPYTYSQNIKKRIKKRIYDEIAINYYQHLKQELINERHAENIGSLVMKIKKLQFKLLELSKENTRGLEKKLRRNSDFESIEKWLELDT